MQSGLKLQPQNYRTSPLTLSHSLMSATLFKSCSRIMFPLWSICSSITSICNLQDLMRPVLVLEGMLSHSGLKILAASSLLLLVDAFSALMVLSKCLGSHYGDTNATIYHQREDVVSKQNFILESVWPQNRSPLCLSLFFYLWSREVQQFWMLFTCDFFFAW